MQVIADLHIHSKYSRAVSKDMDLDGLSRGSITKGISVLGTGDFLHPVWNKELKSKLTECGESVYEYGGIKFILSGEVSLIYRQDGKARRVHHIMLCPGFDVLEQVKEYFAKKGRMDYDGRPIFGFSSAELVESLMNISKDIEIIPAHCLVSGSFIHTNPALKTIENIQKGDKVLTHKGDFKIVTEIYQRPYSGRIFKIIPWYFSTGVMVTPEHPFLAIKTDKKCSWTKGLVCKPTESHKRICFLESYKKYEKEWLAAKDLEKGDVIVYPKLRGMEDRNEIKYDDIIIPVNNEFCRLAGYYLAEGYTNNRDAFCFSFNKNETHLIEDVKNIVKKLFNLNAKKGKTDGDIIFYSKSMMDFFRKLFYVDKPYRANNKALAHWMLKLPLEKQKEILIGWWRGDTGYTNSRILANQMKIICLRLNIIPNILVDKSSSYEKRDRHFINGRKIKSNFDMIAFSRLSFLEDKFNLLGDKNFLRCKSKKDIRHAWFDKNNIFIPIRKIETEEYNGTVYNMEVEDDNSYVTEAAAVHNCWTPWFSLFGSMSGFDSISECFGDRAKYIHAIETGLSSNPAMNWRLSQLDNITLVSNSDSHSPHPYRLGREANVFEMKEVSYENIISAIRTRKGFMFTVEVDPSYGKYHFDGHRQCGFSCEPKEAIRMSNRCPKCKSKLTIGVLHRVEELADREEGFVPKGAVPYKSMLPLSELIANATGTGVFSKKTLSLFSAFTEAFGNEFNVLLNANKEDLTKIDENVADIIIKCREGRLKVTPGFDGEYGRIEGSKQKIHKKTDKEASGQKSLGAFS